MKTEAIPQAGDAAGKGQPLQFVTFIVDNRLYGVDITRVREIKKWTVTTALPNQPEYTRGVLNLRGTIVPVHDLRRRFGGPLTEADESNVVVIVWIGMKTVGILVDAVSDIVSTDAEEIKQVPDAQSGKVRPSIGGLINNASGMIAILDLEALFPTSEAA